MTSVAHGVLRHFADLIDRGANPIPIAPRGKAALVPWKPFQHRRATLADARDWIERYGHEINVGIVCGPISGVVVLDADDAASADWLCEHRPTPMMTRTSRGLHLFYRPPAVPIGNRVRVVSPCGGTRFDVRAGGGYVVTPPSRHPNGHVYARLGPWPHVRTLPMLDTSLLGARTGAKIAGAITARGPSPSSRLDQPVPLPTLRARAWMAKRDGAVEGCGGDAFTYATACKLVVDFGLSDVEALALLREWNVRCSPPWPDVDLVAKVHNARRYGRGAIGVGS